MRGNLVERPLNPDCYLAFQSDKVYLRNTNHVITQTVTFVYMALLWQTVAEEPTRDETGVLHPPPCNIPQDGILQANLQAPFHLTDEVESEFEVYIIQRSYRHFCCCWTPLY